MADDLAMGAIDRIERALARIEAASRNIGTGSSSDGELIELRQTHRALRSKVEGAIGQIDRLLASAERG
jgi:hypothetical protein